jgi:thymus-specific serine protease
LIVWGRSYGGSLAVWARQKYPNVIDGAWASSAPLNAITENTDFMSNVYGTIAQIGGPECGQVISDAFAMIEDAFDAGNTSYVESRLRLCMPIDIGNSYDIARVTSWIARDVGFNFLSNARYPDIEAMCMIINGMDRPLEPPTDPLDAFARWYVDDFHRERECFMVNNEEYVRTYQNIAWNSDATLSGRRQDLWLQCSQLGQFTTANNGQGHPFGTRFDLRFFRQWCVDAFGNDM